MIQRKEFCEYCNSKMENKNAKKRFCSDKCRVYSSRELKMHKNATNKPQISIKTEKQVNNASIKINPPKSPKNEPKEGSIAWFLRNG